MANDKVIHTRIDDTLHQKIFEKCNELGCTFSDFIIESLMNTLERENNFDQIQTESKPPIVPEIKLSNIEANKGIQVRFIGKTEPKVTVTRIER